MPITPQYSRPSVGNFIDHLNRVYGLEIPNPKLSSPLALAAQNSLRWQVYKGTKRLFYQSRAGLERLVHGFAEWLDGRERPMRPGAAAPYARLRRQCSEESLLLDDAEREKRLRYLLGLIEDEIWLLEGGTVREKRASESSTDRSDQSVSPKKRRLIQTLTAGDDGDDEFHTAPNSPTKATPGPVRSPGLDLARLGLTFGDDDDASDEDLPEGEDIRGEWTAMRPPSSFVERLTAAQSAPRGDPMKREEQVTSVAAPEDLTTSFMTTTTTTASSVFTSRLDRSFDTTTTDVTELYTTQTTYTDSVVDWMERSMGVEMPDQRMTDGTEVDERSLIFNKLVDSLREDGPFSSRQTLSQKIPLRFRYELERIGRAWDVPLSKIYKANRVPFASQDSFWDWIRTSHSQRCGRDVPERSPAKAWDAAVGTFKTEKASEVVIMSGKLEWCSPAKPGILKLNLMPLRTDKTCRFHRRFGSDRFMTLTLPAPARPPKHLQFLDHPSVLRESIAYWLTRHDHRCFGRTWRPFYVEQGKGKSKERKDPYFQIELFAIDGTDFIPSPRYMQHRVAPPNQMSDAHTPMSVEDLLEWHMPTAENGNQSNCKLFQRLSLGLSKTYASVALRPSQVVRLRDDPSRELQMNDGCALMSRGLANAICDKLGITGPTPSAFQGRIAGAKGLWMVDRYQSSIRSFCQDDTGCANDIWIQISDTQLKIYPHPQDWDEDFDPEKLIFEVVKWSKPLNPVNLNIQLLIILAHGSSCRGYIAELTRNSIRDPFEKLTEVLERNSNVACRALLQELKPSGANFANRGRQLDQWVANDAEFIMHLCEAGFSPQSFHPLRKRIRYLLNELLDRYIEDLHILVPLSTYAFCIADPYGVLEEDEVHFGFSKNWKDPNGKFEDNLLEGMDVLVGRLPAHLPSDIQRRRAVWKSELRHFKDVIVFPTTGCQPLADMLSGGDYDGDTPWVCWDPRIVERFRNSPKPTESLPVEHFGLTRYSKPMSQVHSTDDFLQGAFEFNLTVSNLGRCTLEHERIAYHKSLDCPEAKELACLLGHLVDGRKGGVHLSEPAWQAFRQKISPGGRAPPAYRNQDQKPKMTNIIDYLKFHVVVKERCDILTELERRFPETESFDNPDKDLTRPWTEAQNAAKIDQESSGHGDLDHILDQVSQSIGTLHKEWIELKNNESYTTRLRKTADAARALAPPEIGSHPLAHTWRNSPHEWRSLLASCCYHRYRNSLFPFHAFGDALCQLKAVSTGSFRTITNEMVACLRINQKMATRLVAGEPFSQGVEETEDSQYEGEDAIAGAVLWNQDARFYDALDDGMSVE
ncbi:RNA-dependent RNA polymerase [Penicillium ucsense]|nr:RNA-dependent RNA polymerase [Penicillium ucsense]